MTLAPAVLVVIQSRLASSRLPAKALLPLGGKSSAVLCAQRAANTGLPVVVATSDRPADDALAAELERAGIVCVRGPHDDVLQRFVQATQALPSQARVVRLTADNVFPDGAFVQTLLDDFEQRGLDYVATGSPQDGLPYGMSAEVFTTASLRRAAREAATAADREHVTPWIRRHASCGLHVVADAPAHWSRLRCTLDSFADYERLLPVFEGLGDAVRSPWRSLVERLADANELQRTPRVPYRCDAGGRVHSALTLGTVQLGLPYGIANPQGLPSEQECADVLRLAAEAGITALDTARAYGVAEARIGRALQAGLRDRVRVVTKLDVLDKQLPPDAGAASVRCAVDASVFASAHALQTRCIDTLLLHRWSHRHAFAEAAWHRLLELKRKGVVAHLGASVSDVPQALAALGDPDIEHLQCPVNLLDARWRDGELLAALRARPDVVVHARSVLLQGLLTLPAQRWVRVPGVDAEQLCKILDHWVATLDRIDRTDLCMAYVRGLPWVTSVVVGMENLQQLRSNLAHAQRPALSPDDIQRIDASLPPLPVALLDPAQWEPA
ncbi:aldo/keto reductase [Piscinibacter sp. XHJ-5]|uniref:aldo/keto reductase n=1 Tax=Piscinibacter sp. XHJ-5 TaxID=3037797 RepID=UPI0024535CC3|nr:aldo/keto reductase [Piscinibacter sp. XHJ-5]